MKQKTYLNLKKRALVSFLALLGFLTDINLRKIKDATEYFLTPKFLLKLSPGSMRKQENGNKLTPLSAFNLNRIDDIRNYETGVSRSNRFRL